MLQFEVATDKCSGCGVCAADCIARIITLENKRPTISPDNEANCIACQHCLTVCPTGAISILGLRPEDSRPLDGSPVDPEALETLVLGRRSYRRYKNENVDPVLLQRLLDASWAAPTGSNRRQVHYILIDDKDVMERIKVEFMEALGHAADEGRIPERLANFGKFVQAWRSRGVDSLFRGAKHLLIATTPKDVGSGPFDSLIALTTFDLLAQANGVGTVWDGLAKIAVEHLIPEFKSRLGIPEDHVIGHMIAFGVPAVHYARTVQRGRPPVARVH